MFRLFPLNPLLSEVGRRAGAVVEGVGRGSCEDAVVAYKLIVI